MDIRNIFREEFQKSAHLKFLQTPPSKPRLASLTECRFESRREFMIIDKVHRHSRI